MNQTPFIFGLILQCSMIMALGAQNLFVLEKGLLRDRPLLVATVCSICDVVLILLGVLGAGTFFAQNEVLTLMLKIAGSSFLFKYAWDKFRESRSSSSVTTDLKSKTVNVKAIILSTLAVSLLNPHVYLDTVVLIGGYSTKYQDIADKLHFATGAGLFSVIWFFSLSSFASVFSSALTKPKTLKVINYGASAIMLFLGINLLLST